MVSTVAAGNVAEKSLINSEEKRQSLAYGSRAFSEGITPEESVRYYSEHLAQGYDQEVFGTHYIGPSLAADLVRAHMPPVAKRATFRILDVACGTGLVGEILHRDGFENIDGLDPSSGMLDKARSKGDLYKNLYERFLYADKPVPDIAEETYDMVISSGAFANAHVPPGALVEIVRMVKRHVGLIGMVCRRVPSSDAERQYQQEFHAVQQHLLDDGVIELVYEKVHDNYSNHEQLGYGRAVVFRRLK